MLEEDKRALELMESRVLKADLDPPCVWFQVNKCRECCILCVSFEMCIERWITKHSFFCPLLLRIHYCSAIINWYRKRRDMQETRK